MKQIDEQLFLKLSNVTNSRINHTIMELEIAESNVRYIKSELERLYKKLDELNKKYSKESK